MPVIPCSSPAPWALYLATGMPHAAYGSSRCAFDMNNANFLTRGDICSTSWHPRARPVLRAPRTPDTRSTPAAAQDTARAAPGPRHAVYCVCVPRGPRVCSPPWSQVRIELATGSGRPETGCRRARERGESRTAESAPSSLCVLEVASHPPQPLRHRGVARDSRVDPTGCGRVAHAAAQLELAHGTLSDRCQVVIDLRQL